MTGPNGLNRIFSNPYRLFILKRLAKFTGALWFFKLRQIVFNNFIHKTDVGGIIQTILALAYENGKLPIPIDVHA